MLEDEAIRRAHQGISVPVLHKGKQVYVDGRPLYKTEYSDQLLMFLLRGLDPERYRERFDHKVQLDSDPDNWSSEQRNFILDEVLKLACDGDADKATRLREHLESQARARLAASEQTIDVEPAAEVEGSGSQNGSEG